MTVIMGVLNKGKVHMMGDSMVSAGERDVIHINKLWKDQDFIIGCAGSLRCIQILKRSIKFPPQNVIEEENLDIGIDFFTNQFCPQLKQFFKQNDIKGLMEILIAYKDKLFYINHEFIVFEVQDCKAIGSGTDYAKASYEYGKTDNIESSLFNSVKAAVTNIRSCGFPAYYINTEEKQFKEYYDNGQFNYVNEDNKW